MSARFAYFAGLGFFAIGLVQVVIGLRPGTADIWLIGAMVLLCTSEILKALGK